MDDREPAPSTWSISGPATIIGAGASATVAGTAPSASEYDVVVHSVCNETGQTDDELLTVVGVESIEADPEVVCVDGEVSYTITTQPEGYNYMVEYESADTSTPGIKEVIATCGTSSATCTVTVVGAEIAEFDRVAPTKTKQVDVTIIPSPLPAGYSITLVCEPDPGTVGSAPVSPDTINDQKACRGQINLSEKS